MADSPVDSVQSEQRDVELVSDLMTSLPRAEWQRCDACGQRAPSAALLLRHRLRRCFGPLERAA